MPTRKLQDRLSALKYESEYIYKRVVRAFLRQLVEEVHPMLASRTSTRHRSERGSFVSESRSVAFSFFKSELQKSWFWSFQTRMPRSRITLVWMLLRRDFSGHASHLDFPSSLLCGFGEKLGESGKEFGRFTVPLHDMQSRLIVDQSK
jgi:hypothetical protein